MKDELAERTGHCSNLYFNVMRKKLDGREADVVFPRCLLASADYQTCAFLSPKKDEICHKIGL